MTEPNSKPYELHQKSDNCIAIENHFQNTFNPINNHKDKPQLLENSTVAKSDKKANPPITNFTMLTNERKSSNDNMKNNNTNKISALMTSKNHPNKHNDSFSSSKNLNRNQHDKNKENQATTNICTPNDANRNYKMSCQMTKKMKLTTQRTIKFISRTIIFNNIITTPITIEPYIATSSSNPNITKGHRNIVAVMKMINLILKTITSGKKLTDTLDQFHPNTTD